MRRAFVLIFLAACGKPPPAEDPSWINKPEVVAEFSNRNNYPIAGRTPVIRGKLLVVNMGDKPYIDGNFNARLPKELFPHKKEEVGTLAWIRELRTVVGKYSGGTPAVQESYEVTIVDNIDKQAIWTSVFDGPKPDKEIHVRASEYRDSIRTGVGGGLPFEKVVEYLLSLPRQ